MLQLSIVFKGSIINHCQRQYYTIILLNFIIKLLTRCHHQSTVLLNLSHQLMIHPKYSQGSLLPMPIVVMLRHSKPKSSRFMQIILKIYWAGMQRGLILYNLLLLVHTSYFMKKLSMVATKSRKDNGRLRRRN